MLVFRIVKLKKRTKDISGIGAFNEGGRWNNEGVFALYTSENEALAMLEILVNVDLTEFPPNMFVMSIQIDDDAPFYKVPDKTLPKNSRLPENIFLIELGDKIFKEKKYIGIKARSAVMENSYNFILNPVYPGFYNLVKVIKVNRLEIDKKLIRIT
ncbi:MAG: RES family NAD+ phosphorylase [Ginsengibacter sp.]